MKTDEEASADTTTKEPARSRLRPALLPAAIMCALLAVIAFSVVYFSSARYGHMNMAIEAGDAFAVRCMVWRGVDVNAPAYEGNTPMRFAVRHGRVEFVHQLIALGVDVKWCSRGGFTALHWLDENSREIAAILIENGADIEALTSTGMTPLLRAARWSELSVVEALLDMGADVNGNDAFWASPLECAVRWGDPGPTALLLIERGANVDGVNVLGDTILHLTTSVEVAKLLIAKGADVNARGWEGRTPLHSAENIELVEYLLKKGATIDARDRRGRTPLRSAVQGWRSEIVKYLLEKGANPDVGDKDGLTPLQCAVDSAVQGWGSEIVKYLLEKGANPDVVDKDGLTPLQCAVDAEAEGIVTLLKEAGAKE